MCRFFAYCERPCRTHQSHFAHWKHVRLYCLDKDPNYLSYNLYRRLMKVDDSENDIMVRNPSKRAKVSESNLIHRGNYEKYLVSNMVSKLIDDIVDNIDKKM